MGPYGPFSQGLCVSGFKQIGAWCYKLVETAEDQADARQECINLNSRLAWIETADELCAVGELIDDWKATPPRGGISFWIGGIRIGSDNEFHWIEANNVNLGKAKAERTPPAVKYCVMYKILKT